MLVEVRSIHARVVALLAGASLTALGVSACANSGDEAQQAADRLASALSSGKLSSTLFAPTQTSPQSAYDAVVAGMGDVSPDVTVTSVKQDGNVERATLAWSWDLAGHWWRYDSQAALRQRSGRWVADWTPALVEPSLSDGEHLALSTLAAQRGRVLGAHGTTLVKDRPVVRFGIDKTKVAAAKTAASARDLARILNVDASGFVRAVRAAGPKAFVEAIVLRPGDARAVPAAYKQIPGAVALGSTLPLAPTREFAAEILGRVGPATAALIKQSHGRLHAGDVAGLSGLQLRYDEQLGGTPGVEVDASNGSGKSRRLFTVGPVAGKDLRTTLDPQWQLKADRVLAGQPGKAALVVIRPSTGDLLAIANAPANNGLNIATYGQYAPGSTFKLISSLALLRAGMSPASTGDCPPTVSVSGKQFKNYSDYPSSRLGRITLRDAVANSCNTFFVGSADRLKKGALSDAAAALGLGTDFDLGFPAYFGQVPDPGSATEAAADMIGQGKVLASPMVMAAVAASIAAGHTVVPHLVAGYEPTAKPSNPLTHGEAAQLRSLMRSVVTEGSGAVLAGLGPNVGAKTGTAEYGQPGPGGALPTHAWMLATRGDLAVAAFVENGQSGSQTAGPLLLKLLS